MKKWIVNRITYSSIIIEAETRKEADDMIGEIDGDDDNWEYYDEEFFLRDENGKTESHTAVEYDEYSMTHTVNRDDDVNEGKSLTVSTWISGLNDMDRILLNRIEALEDETKKISNSLLSFKKHTSDRMLRNRLEALDKIGELEQLTQKLIDIQVTEDVDRHDDLVDELWIHKK